LQTQLETQTRDTLGPAAAAFIAGIRAALDEGTPR
jgi:hypothetical protein